MKSKLLTLVAVLLLLGVVASCSDDSENGNGGKITIGLLAPFSGPLQGYGLAMKNAAQMAAKEINAAGGLLSGQDIEVVSKDDGTDATKSEEAAKALLASNPELVGFVGPATSGSAEAVAKLMDKETPKVNVISASATAPNLSDLGLSNFYRTIASDAYQGEVAATKAVSLGKKNAAILYVDNAYGKGLAAAFKKQFVDVKGQAVVAEVSYPEQSDYKNYDFSNEVDQLLVDPTTKPDILFLVTYFEDGAKFTQFAKDTLATMNPAPLLFGCDGNKSTDFIAAADATTIEGMMGTAPALDVEDPNYKEFSKNYKAAFNVEPKLFAEGAYDALYLMAYAIEAAGQADKTAFVSKLIGVSGPAGDKINVNKWAEGKAAIKAGKDIDYSGAAGDINWDSKGDVDKNTVNYQIWKITNGAIEQVETVKPE